MDANDETPGPDSLEGRGGDLVPLQADSDATLLRLWLHGKADRTSRAYQDDVGAFLRHAGKPLRQITLADVVAYGESLAHLAPATRARALGSIKSLAAFGHRIGYLPFDVGAPVRVPPVKQTLAERILGEGEVYRLLASRLQRHRRPPLPVAGGRRPACLLVGV